MSSYTYLVTSRYRKNPGLQLCSFCGGSGHVSSKCTTKEDQNKEDQAKGQKSSSKYHFYFLFYSFMGPVGHYVTIYMYLTSFRYRKKLKLCSFCGGDGHVSSKCQEKVKA